MSSRIQMLAIVLVAVATASADTLRVPSEYPTIQAAMNAAQNGDTVLVADGTYTGPGNNNLSFNGKVFTVRSENGPENCIIDCGGDALGFWFDFNPPTTVVDGFTITNGGGYPGGGIYMYYDGNPTIRNCMITGNTSDFNGGGGIRCEGAFPTIINCTITGNTAGTAGGGGVHCMMSSPTIRNCTITGNSTEGSGGGIYSTEGSNPMITNSILWDNGPQEISVDQFSTVVVLYSDIQGGWPGESNIDVDPLFVDPDTDDYRLLPGSAAIDAADNTSLPPNVTTDLEGNPRFVDDPVTQDTGYGGPPITDMGAFEYFPGDFDHDGDTDLLDFERYLACITGPGGGQLPECESSDLDADDDTDFDDFAVFQLTFTGPP
ncbi:MAG: right-handed parallel beta-helix repeat-containing protein [Gemmatimonadetes bacterium]|nr:right-handed parallel beta-helix repeat-containing protein [Gemmatimonadota bacterium]